jgi:hypothetical protein
MNPQLQDALADAAYHQLQAELTAAGYEVVPEEQVKAAVGYRALIQQAGYANHSRYANAMGDVALVSAPGLDPYLAYNGETGSFSMPTKSYLGWVSGFGGNSTTAGGPSSIKQGSVWKVPGLEVALAKELNAHVVKATYVISLGKATARRRTGFDTSQHNGLFVYQGDLYSGNYTTIDRTVTGSGRAFAEVGLVADQSHIALRTPDGNAKWQSVARMHVAPPKDGDVVVRVTEPVIGSAEYFDVSEGQIDRTGGMFSGQKRGDINLGFIASISNPSGYGREVTGMIGVANKAMVGLLKAP